MSDPTQNVRFIQFHYPSLEAGDYAISVQQTIEIKAGKSKLDKERSRSHEDFPETKRTFSIQCERFSLPPQAIQAVFPPEGSLGDHSNVLPHIILKRSTLPWERSAVEVFRLTETALAQLEKEKQLPEDIAKELGALKGQEYTGRKPFLDALKTALGEHDLEFYQDLLLRYGRSPIPWLALLLFDEAEAPEPQVITVNDLMTPPAKAGIFPSVLRAEESEAQKTPFLKLERAQQERDKLTIIDVEAGVLKALLPTLAELAALTHVRQGAGVPQGQEVAVVIGNRLPASGRSSIAHLVSVEQRYTQTGFDDQQAGERDLIRLISLKSWRFGCADETNFKLTAAALKRLKTLLQLSEDAWKKLEALKGLDYVGQAAFLEALKTALGEREVQLYQRSFLTYGRYQKLNFKGLLTQLNREPSTLRLPYNPNPAAEAYLSAGYVPMQHYERHGQQMVSWYRGPLVTAAIPPAEIAFPAPAADALLRYNKHYGMFEVTYAAAWELGRWLALRSKPFSIGLYQWKRAHAQQIRQAEQSITHLPLNVSAAGLALPTSIKEWFRDLALLRGVPFNYLVPDERMLPRESIRFFQVDPVWIGCLLDGAFSIGRVTSADHRRDQAHAQSPAQNPYESLSGFLLRSEVVAGWPDLQVDGYTDTIASDDFEPVAAAHQPIRMARLAANVLLCLFESTIKTVDIHQKPEALHFGLDEPDHLYPDGYHKILRDPQNGREDHTVRAAASFRNTVTRVVDIAALQKSMQDAINAAHRAKTFQQGVPDLLAGQFALQMIEGVQKVRLSDGGT